MKKLSIFTLAVAATVLFAFKPLTNLEWSSDASHSRLGFVVTHIGITDFYGNFNTFEVKATGTNADFSDATVELSADAASIFTANEMRDKHLKSEAFFDVEKFPKFTFKSTSFKKAAKGEYNLVGDLTLHGVTKSITLKAKHTGDVVHPMSKKDMSAFKVTGSFKRSDFNIGKDMPEAVVSDLVRLNVDLELAKN